MSFLRGVYRRKTIDEDYTGQGGGIANWIQGSNINPDFRFGGFVMFSFASQLSGAGFLQVSAFDMLTSTYGVSFVSNVINTGSAASTTTGFKVIPLGFMDYSGDQGSAAVFYALSATQALAGDDSVVVITPKVYIVSGPVTSASNRTVHFVANGYVVSVPNTYK